MSIQAVAWALDQHPDNLPGKPKLVLVSIANHADHRTGYCWLTLETISHESSQPIRSLYRYIGALVRNGYLRKQLRKGEDGKQRATDYWILFNREPNPWDWGARGPDGDPLDVVGDESDPSATQADGENGADAAPSADLADGPSANGGTAYNDEPSYIKPSYEEEARARASETPAPPPPPRGYRPPPVEPMGAVLDPQGRQVFVIKGTRAWDAHCAERRRQGKGSPPTVWAIVNGKSREGWYFANLFPPNYKPPDDPLSDQDAADFKP